MLTKQGENLAKIPWNVYPRPQLKRDSFFCLNGEWDFYFNKKEAKIIVPFSPESLLSGIRCRNNTSCPDQLAKAIGEYKASKN